jgi:hypothetical protein
MIISRYVELSGDLAESWLLADYAGVMSALKDELKPGQSLQSVRLVIGGNLQKASLNALSFSAYNTFELPVTAREYVDGFQLRIREKGGPTGIRVTRAELVTSMKRSAGAVKGAKTRKKNLLKAFKAAHKGERATKANLAKFAKNQARARKAAKTRKKNRNKDNPF